MATGHDASVPDVGGLRFRARKPRTFGLSAPVTDYLGPELDTWPNNIKDQIYEAMEALMVKTGVKELEIIQAICFFDMGIWQITVTVMEKLGVDDITIERIQ